MAYALKIKHSDLEVDMIPGELRKKKSFVKIGSHIAPNPDDLITILMNLKSYIINVNLKVKL